MKISMVDFDKVVELNNLKEITGQSLYQRGEIPNPDGLISNEIFGNTVLSRKQTYGYIDLHKQYFHPHIYYVVKRLYKNIDAIINGQLYCKINENGNLVADENGQTGIKFIYDNWNKIDWDFKKDNNDKGGNRYERLNILNNFKKDEIFISKMLVIPPFYRDVASNKAGEEVDDLNKMYQKLIRYATLNNSQDMFDFEFYNNDYEIQTTIFSIYDYFKTKLEKKNGIIRKYLMGKNVDYCTRTVITAPRYDSNDPDDQFVSFEYSAIPISQICSLAYPFVMYYLKSFFTREVIDRKEISVYNPITDKLEDNIIIDNPEGTFTEKYIKNIIDTFCDDPESRFNKIPLTATNGKVFYLALSGSRYGGTDKSELAATVSRPMTWTDLLYLACNDAVKNKYCIITRYPVSDDYGLFTTKIRVGSTLKTTPMLIDGVLHKWYPVVELDTPTNMIGSKFVDSSQFSNSYLPAIVGDYDGDQTTIKILFTQEANADCEKALYSKSNFINSAGTCVRSVGNEVIQTFYDLTKDPDSTSKEINQVKKMEFLNTDPSDITLDYLNDLFAVYADSSNGNSTSFNKPKFNTNDYFTINPKEYEYAKITKPIVTTLGRLMFYKVIVERAGLGLNIPYFNIPINKDKLNWLDNTVVDLLRDDIIGTKDAVKYIDYRDWLGLTLNATLAPPFTKNLIITPPKTDALKKKLLKQYDKEIKSGNSRVIEDIENQLKASLKEELKDNPGIDLINSGSRASLDNHLKNFMLTRGSVLNANTGQYEIISNSLMDGLDKKDIPAHANSILNGAYAKTVSTADSGYMGKKISAAAQGETVGEPGSDCGSLRTLSVDITKDNANKYTLRYIKEGNKLVLLDENNINDYIGKTVQMRSPMFCARVGENKCICNKCAGEFFYKIGRENVGIAAMKIGGSLTNINMKKFHKNLIVSKKIDMDDILL